MKKVAFDQITAKDLYESAATQQSFQGMGIDDFVSITMNNEAVFLTVLGEEHDAKIHHNRNVDEVCDFFEFGDGVDLPRDDMPVFAVSKDNGVMSPVIRFDVRNVIVGGEAKIELVTLMR